MCKAALDFCYLSPKNDKISSAFSYNFKLSLAEIDTACEERMGPAMAKQEGVTEALKAPDQVAWVGRMNNIRSRAEDFISCG